ncbi:MAG TPA: hypothetical protein VFT43_16200 [Candidatus Polarisedimenticolia bacterium]|nr:hypothetical protein [Candidatus Polarisedimenticolia bacterium]
MPYDDPDPQDPMLLVGVALPGGEAEEREMAYVFAEEFARLGYDERQLLSLFKQPFYAGAFRAWRHLGEEAVTAIVRETVGVWGRMRCVDREPGPSGTGPHSGGCADE